MNIRFANERTRQYVRDVEAAIERVLQSRGAYQRTTIYVLVKVAVQIAKFNAAPSTEIIVSARRSEVTLNGLHDLLDELWSRLQADGELGPDHRS